MTRNIRSRIPVCREEWALRDEAARGRPTGNGPEEGPTRANLFRGRRAIADPEALPARDRVRRSAIAFASACAAVLVALAARDAVADGTETWSAPVVLEDAPTDALGPQVAVDAGGNATVAWQLYTLLAPPDRQNAIRANRFILGRGWQGAETLTNLSSWNAFAPTTAVGSAGEAFVAWQEWNGTAFRIVVRRHAPGAGWDENAILANATTPPLYRPRIGVDGSGVTHVAWEGWGGSGVRIHWAAYAPGAGWSAPVPIDAGAGDAHAPEIAVDRQGTSTAVWYAFDGIANGIFAATRPPGGAWDAPARLDAAAGGDASNPALSMDPGGRGFAAWPQYEGGPWGIWAARHVPDAGWDNASRVDRGTGVVEDVQIAAGGNGSAVAVWKAFGETRALIQASRFVPASGWTPPVNVSEGIPDSASDPQVAMDAAGRALAVWTHANGSYHAIYASRSEPSGGWGPPVRIGSASVNASASGRFPRVAMDGRGGAIAVWERGASGPRAVAAHFFAAAPPGPPGPDGGPSSVPIRAEWIALSVLAAAGAIGTVAWVAISRRTARPPGPK